MHKLPLGKGSAELVAVKYPAEVGGYTPGDTWELYAGKDNRVEEFAYHRGGTRKPSLRHRNVAGYKKAGPLLISTEHAAPPMASPCTSSLLMCQLSWAGSDTWMKAE